MNRPNSKIRKSDWIFVVARRSDGPTPPDSFASTLCQTAREETVDAYSFAVLSDFSRNCDVAAPAATSRQPGFKISVKCSAAEPAATSNLYAHDFCFHPLYLWMGRSFWRNWRTCPTCPSASTDLPRSSAAAPPFLLRTLSMANSVVAFLTFNQSDFAAPALSSAGPTRPRFCSSVLVFPFARACEIYA